MAMNVLYYDVESKEKVFDALKKHVRSKVDKISMLDIQDWSNKVFVMSKDAKVKNDQWRANPSIEAFIDNTKVLENILKNWKVQNKNSWIKDMDMSDHALNFMDFDK
jgi:hypothetical protein